MSTTPVQRLSPEAQERIRAEAREIMERVLRGEDKPKRSRSSSPRKSPTGLKRGENMLNRPPKYSRSEIVALYKSGKMVKEIVEITGAHRGTVSRALTESGLDPAERKGGPNRKELCGAGLHDMAVYGKEIPKPKGGRRCGECDRIRGRKYYHEKTKHTRKKKN